MDPRRSVLNLIRGDVNPLLVTLYRSAIIFGVQYSSSLSFLRMLGEESTSSSNFASMCKELDTTTSRELLLCCCAARARFGSSMMQTNAVAIWLTWRLKSHVGQVLLTTSVR